MKIASNYVISRKAVKKLIKPPEVTFRQGAGDHLIISGPKGSAVLVVDRKVGPGLAAKMRKDLIGAGVVSAEEFEHTFGKDCHR